MNANFTNSPALRSLNFGVQVLRTCKSIYTLLLFMGISLFFVEKASAQVDLEVVSVTLQNSPLVPGASASFDITVRNNGADAAPGAIVNFDIIDANWLQNIKKKVNDR
jgi:hypothetical protein